MPSVSHKLIELLELTDSKGRYLFHGAVFFMALQRTWHAVSTSLEKSEVCVS